VDDKVDLDRFLNLIKDEKIKKKNEHESMVEGHLHQKHKDKISPIFNFEYR